MLQIVFGVLALGLVIFVFTREPKKPALPRWEMQDKLLEKAEEKAKIQAKKSADAELVKLLLKEKLSGRTFDFAVVAEAASGKKVIPFQNMKSAERVKAAVFQAADELVMEMNREDSPIRQLSRINEGSKLFEDGFQRKIDAMDGLKCEYPKTREGVEQRSGYPDLIITDEATGELYYLDPKLLEQGSIQSSLRTFYFEPKNQTLKITQDAAHLLIGIEHDGQVGKWNFFNRHLVDLSNLQVGLKAEFQANNQDIYSERSVLETRSPGEKDTPR